MSLVRKTQINVSGFKSTPSKALTFYQGDVIRLEVTIGEINLNLKTGRSERVTYSPLRAKMLIDTPDKEDMVESVNIEGDILTFDLDKTHTKNLGITKCMVILLDDDGCEVTIPEFTFEVKERLNVLETKAVVDETPIGYSTISEGTISVGDEWVKGEIISSTKLNSIANEVKKVPQLEEKQSELSTSLETIANVIDDTMSQNEVQYILNNSRKVIVKRGNYIYETLVINNVEIEGEGVDNTYFSFPTIFGSNAKVSNIKFGSDIGHNTFLNNSRESVFTNCYFTGGLDGISSGAIYINGISINDIYFKNCEFAGSKSTGLHIVDKSTLDKHIENITIDTCYFHDNKLGNLGCISRTDSGVTPVSGYKNIKLINSTFEKELGLTSAYQINVSFDSLESDDINFSGGVYVDNCKFINGYYAFECAGAVDLIFTNNTVVSKNTTKDIFFSMSRFDGKYCNALIENNKFISSVAGVLINGDKNVFKNNVVDCVKEVTFLNGEDVQMKGNSIKSANYTISLNNISNCKVSNNILNNITSSDKNTILIYNCVKKAVTINNNVIITNNSLYQKQISTCSISEYDNTNENGFKITSFYKQSTAPGTIVKKEMLLNTAKFRVKNYSKTKQSNCIIKLDIVSRNSNQVVGYSVNAYFNTYNVGNSLPVFSKSDVSSFITCICEETETSYDFIFETVFTKNSSTLFNIEMITSDDKWEISF